MTIYARRAKNDSSVPKLPPAATGDPWSAFTTDAHPGSPASKQGDAALLSALSLVSRFIREDPTPPEAVDPEPAGT